MTEQPTRFTFEQTVARIVELAAEHGGTITRRQIEADRFLCGDRALTSAAGHALAGGTNVAATSSQGGWFPYESLTLGGAKAISPSAKNTSKDR